LEVPLNNFVGPGTISVGSHSSFGGKIHANLMTGNELAGVSFVNTDNSTVDTNSIGGSRNGIFVDSQSTKNTIENNNVLKNDVDLNNADGLPLNMNQNEFLSNKCFVSQPSGYCIGQ
jgi:parallel beta-helix repeat protein